MRCSIALLGLMYIAFIEECWCV